MTDKTIFDRIVVSREVMVVQVLDLLAAGKTPTEIVSQDYYPDLTEAYVRACIAYASQMIRS